MTHTGADTRLFLARPPVSAEGDAPHVPVFLRAPLLDGPLSESLLGRPNSPRWHGIPRRCVTGAFLSMEATMSFPAETIVRRYGKTPEQLAEDLHCLAERIAREVELSFTAEREALRLEAVQ